MLNKGAFALEIVRGNNEMAAYRRVMLNRVTSTAGLTVYIMDHPDLTVSNLMESSIGLKRAKAMA